MKVAIKRENSVLSEVRPKAFVIFDAPGLNRGSSLPMAAM
jgi:hypothetical protein